VLQRLFQLTGMHLAPMMGMQHLEKLRAKLCRELAQSEHSADVHTRREARRLGDVPPAHALLALGEHASAEEARFDVIACNMQHETGLQLARAIGQAFSTLRHLMFDRMIDTERSFRGTLLGFRHGIDISRLLREVATRLGDTELVEFIDAWQPRRLELLHAAEATLGWFADSPARALQSGLRTAIASK
jgi:hypothetical protein